MITTLGLVVAGVVLGGTVYAQEEGGGGAPVPITTATGTTTAGASEMTARTALKLAKKYTASTFLSEWDWFTDDDLTAGYVNYVSQSDASALGIASTLENGAFYMGADSTNQASGRGRNSVRISSKDKFADGVYILDLNHLPVGCGTWPAFWTTTSTGWPKGGEIDILEGSNSYPTLNSRAYNATQSSGRGISNATLGYPLSSNVASLHTSDNCQLSGNTYQTGSVGSTTCDAHLNGNTGCGVELAGENLYGSASFGRGVNEVGGGYYAMWRDLENSGGIYIYYWPRNAQNIPADITDSTRTTTNVADWGQPGANLSVPSCKSDFNNHVIVFDVTFCGAYATATYAQSGCPLTCTSFVQSNPTAFAEAYWSINSLRVYTTSGSPATDSSTLSKGAIAGIAIGAAAALLIAGFIFWCLKRRRDVKQKQQIGFLREDDLGKTTYQGWAGVDTEVGGSGDNLLPNLPSATRSTAALSTSSKRSKSSKKGKQDKDKVKVRAFAPAHPMSVEAEEAVQADRARRSSVRVNKSQKIESQFYPQTGNRVGPTTLRDGRTARHFLFGETGVAASSSDGYRASGGDAEGLGMQPMRSQRGSWAG